MRTVAPIVDPRLPGTTGDLLWRPFSEQSPPEGAIVLVGHPEFGVLLQQLQREGQVMFAAQRKGDNRARTVFGKTASFARSGDWWMLLPHVGPEAR